MSKLVCGDAAINDLDVVREAAHTLGWAVHVERCVRFYEGPGPMCDMVVQTIGEMNKYQEDIGKKYTIGFQQDKTTGKVSILYDNAMDGGAMYSVESGQQDETTQRIVGKLKQAIAQVQVQHVLTKQKASWRVETRADGAQIFVIKR